MTVMRDVNLPDKNAWGEDKITKIQFFYDDDVLRTYLRHPAVLDMVESIIGSDIKMIHNMLINKPRDLGKGSSRHPPHQDYWYFPMTRSDRIVAAWTAMEKIDEENGCLFVVPGTHLEGLRMHEYPEGSVNRSYHGIQGFDFDKARAEGKVRMCHMDAGDTIFFHPLLIHGSGPNTSPRFRKAISGHFANALICKLCDTEGTMKDMIAKETTMLARRKGLEIRHRDIYSIIARSVRGEEAFDDDAL